MVDTDFSKFNCCVVDADWILHSAANAGEKKTIKAVLTPTGEEFNLRTRTELWGRKRSKDGGHLEELNKSRNTSYTWEDFEIFDIQTPDEISKVLHSTKMMVEGITKTTGIEKKELYVGEGRSFRHGRSTLIEYKGNRANLLTAIHKDAVKGYLIKYHGAKVIKDLEVDDVVIMRGYEDEKNLVISVDKDSMSCPVYLYNPTHPEWGILDCRGLGHLWWDTTGKTKKLRGIGRKWFYTQALLGDSVDAISPTAASDMQFGEVGAYEALNACKTDYDCLKAIKDVYQYLYPEPRTVIGWRGDTIKCDWLYVLNEVWDLVRMRRFEGDIVTASDVFKKFGLLE